MTHEFSRLPTNVKPIKYTLHYDVVDLTRFRFEGREEVSIAVTQDTKTITCHAIELWVHSVKVVRQDGTAVACLETRFIEEDQTITFVLDETLVAGTTATIHLAFSGLLNDALRGFYRSEYEHDGQKRIMAASQFQACDARRAFVCWDEPAIKATFEISMATPVHLTAISNMHVLSTSVRPSTLTFNGAEKVWHFAETPIMSTYLVALVVGEFDTVSDYTDEGVLVNIYTPLGKAVQGQFALSVATKALSFFTKAFGLPYPLKKLDNLAIPDFAAGAMENWGCILYRETALLIEPGQSSKAKRTQVALTVAHELAHQWFGNLVTMEWWTGLWLNEGFAHFMEYDAVDHIFPEWNMWENFVQEVTLDSAFREDALLSSHMIEVDVNHPDEADEIFDAISYCKGASVIRMLSEYLGKDVFYRGIQIYLKRFSYSNAVTIDLWEALEEASDLPLSAMMNTWTKQTGFPVVTLSRTPDGVLSLAQTRFFSDPSVVDPDDSRWDLPLTAQVGHGSGGGGGSELHRVGIWTASDLPARDAAFEVHAPTSVGSKFPADSPWIKLNGLQQGFYIDNYDADGWLRLQSPCQQLVLSEVDRMCLLDNAFVLTRAGKLDLANALEFSRAFANDPSYLIWKSLSTHLTFYGNLIHQTSTFPKFQAYVRQFYDPQLARLGWFTQDTDQESTAYFRSEVIRMLGAAKDPAVLADAVIHFQTLVTTPEASRVTSDLRAVIFRVVATHLQGQVYDQLRTLYESSDLAELKNDCLGGMGAVQTKWNDTLEWALSGKVRSQDIQYAFAGVVRSGIEGADFAWAFIQANWDRLNDKYIPNKVGSLVCLAIGRFQSENKAVEVEAFLGDKKTTAYKRRLDTTLEGIRIKAACFRRDATHLDQWLTAQTL
ncbi:hypothetical protein H257_00544 [Aphanomyces astaci]|uniref:Aminopeptidase n=3 Tax=Aphanomyces astaci TaxID=112090 RepID=W4HB71_APHAT|nr:hypothetical protein H257_00544 [Aphanomyces astaci]ETV89177.1 hypothetical protein H257_00544 [Aphanomyces astaci]|eukprot:XP_009821577.1 hypothetical protein H257_00544 [Aphanomyces astaci]